MSDLNSFMTSAHACSTQRNGHRLASLLALPTTIQDFNGTPHKALVDKAKGMNFMAYASSNIGDSGVAAVTGLRMQALCCLVLHDYKKAYEHELAAYNSILECIKDENSVWILPVLVRISNDLRLLAMQADSEFGTTDFLRNSLENLTKGFTAIAKDRTPVSVQGSKRVAIFAVTNVLFKIYFKVNTLQLCSKLISVVEGPSGVIDNLNLYPVGDVVTYKYYLGRLKLFEDKFEEARDNLRFALSQTPVHSLRNRQRILASLIPVEMCLGVMPSELVATKYGFHEYYAMGVAAKVGDLKTIEQILSENQKAFIRIGVYLVLEQVKTLGYRSLIKRVYNITASTRLNIASFESILKWLGVDMDMDEIECILANLIFNNKIKGYISHQKRVLVVSKADPFPTSAVVKKARK